MTTEHQEQAALCKYLGFRNIRFYSIPNGVFLKDKKSSYKIMSKLKAEGLSKGICDLCIPVPTKKYHGLYIEMKRLKGGAVSEEQKEWLDYLNSVGYKAIVCKGYNEAIEQVELYLKEV
jgi:hypothetical protein